VREALVDEIHCEKLLAPRSLKAHRTQSNFPEKGNRE
jgi:hypothetical protein